MVCLQLRLADPHASCRSRLRDGFNASQDPMGLAEVGAVDSRRQTRTPVAYTPVSLPSKNISRVPEHGSAERTLLELLLSEMCQRPISRHSQLLAWVDPKRRGLSIVRSTRFSTQLKTVENDLPGVKSSSPDKKGRTILNKKKVYRERTWGPTGMNPPRRFPSVKFTSYHAPS